MTIGERITAALGVLTTTAVLFLTGAGTTAEIERSKLRQFRLEGNAAALDMRGVGCAGPGATLVSIFRQRGDCRFRTVGPCEH
jgi:hypothetical protein